MANDLTTTTPLDEAKTVCAEFSPGLKSLLQLGDTASAIDHLAHTPVMLAEVQRALPSIEVLATFPAGPSGVRRVLAPALVLFRLDMSEGEWGVWWKTYIELLEDLPETALEAGLKAHLRSPDAEFMPKPGKLRELALTTANTAAQMLERARGALRRAHIAEEHRGPPVSREQVDRMLAGYRQNVAERKAMEAALRPQPPNTAGRPDETGITPELRAVMAQRMAD